MTVWGIDIYDGSNAQVQTFINRTGVTFPVLTKGSSIATTYCSGLEDFYVVDRTGIVTYISRDYDETGLQAHLNQLTDVEDSEVTSMPGDFRLEQNYPNPFNPGTRIKFHLAGTQAIPVMLQIFNSRGEKVRTMVEKHLIAGSYQESWDGRDDEGIPLTAGVYYYRLTAGHLSETRKMLLLK